MILEPERGMRTSHCSKTYQLGAVGSANSACFRDFLRLITGIWTISMPPAVPPAAVLVWSSAGLLVVVVSVVVVIRGVWVRHLIAHPGGVVCVKWVRPQPVVGA